MITVNAHLYYIVLLGTHCDMGLPNLTLNPIPSPDRRRDGSESRSVAARRWICGDVWCGRGDATGCPSGAVPCAAAAGPAFIMPGDCLYRRDYLLSRGGVGVRV